MFSFMGAKNATTSFNVRHQVHWHQPWDEAAWPPMQSTSWKPQWQMHSEQANKEDLKYSSKIAKEYLGVRCINWRKQSVVIAVLAYTWRTTLVLALMNRWALCSKMHLGWMTIFSCLGTRTNVGHRGPGTKSASSGITIPGSVFLAILNHFFLLQHRAEIQQHKAIFYFCMDTLVKK